LAVEATHDPGRSPTKTEGAEQPGAHGMSD
jgi:hypothetical protein